MDNVAWLLKQTLYAFQQCKNFEKLLRFDNVTESLEVGTFFRHGVESELCYSQLQLTPTESKAGLNCKTEIRSETPICLSKLTETGLELWSWNITVTFDIVSEAGSVVAGCCETLLTGWRREIGRQNADRKLTGNSERKWRQAWSADDRRGQLTDRRSIATNSIGVRINRTPIRGVRIVNSDPQRRRANPTNPEIRLCYDWPLHSSEKYLTIKFGCCCCWWWWWWWQ